MFRNFMQGRYGNDQLNIAILISALVLGLCSFAARGVVYAIFLVLEFSLLALWALRAFSRNFYNRRKENNVFLKLWNPVKNCFKGVPAFFKRLGDRQHKYFKCPKCKSRLRVPRGRGSITVTCPRCAHKFDKKS